MKNYGIKEARRIIVNSASKFEKELADKELLFLFRQDHNYRFLRTLIYRRNFLHLTGVVTSLRPEMFYQLSLSNRLSFHHFNKKKNGTTDLKLSVLEQMTSIHKLPVTVGDYDGIRLNLHTDKIVGATKGFLCVGFKWEKETYLVPNTLLCERANCLSSNNCPVVLTLRKGLLDSRFEITYRSRSLDETTTQRLYREAVKWREEIFQTEQQASFSQSTTQDKPTKTTQIFEP